MQAFNLTACSGVALHVGGVGAHIWHMNVVVQTTLATLKWSGDVVSLVAQGTNRTAQDVKLLTFRQEVHGLKWHLCTLHEDTALFGCKPVVQALQWMNECMIAKTQGARSRSDHCGVS